ncbi:MAG: peptidylprolyl isomerase [Spirulina sp.]
MANTLNIGILPQEIMGFLRRDLKLKSIYRDIIAQRIIQQVAEESGQVVADTEVQQELDALVYDYQLDRPAQLIPWAADRLATLDDIRQRIAEKLLFQKVARHLFLAQVQEQFNTHNRDFQTISLYKILVPYESLAREIFYQIEEEEISFFEAAHIYDIDETRRLRCGFEGRMQRWQLPLDLADLLRDIAVGAVVGPRPADRGYSMLLLVDELVEPEQTPETLDQRIDYLFQDWLTHHLATYLNHLREDPHGQISDM